MMKQRSTEQQDLIKETLQAGSKGEYQISHQFEWHKTTLKEEDILEEDILEEDTLEEDHLEEDTQKEDHPEEDTQEEEDLQEECGDHHLDQPSHP